MVKIPSKKPPSHDGVKEPASYVKGLRTGAILALLAIGCAGFNYRYYGLDVEQVDTHDGHLLGPKPKDDLSLDVCKRTQNNKSPCVVLLTDEFFKMIRDMKELEVRLKHCEKP